ncbi:MAG: hypothetical protein ACKV22_09065 [Bryobacteraceae bacterium]
MTITIPPLLWRRVQQHVQNGSFENSQALVEEAITFFLDAIEEEGELDHDQMKAALEGTLPHPGDDEDSGQRRG